MKKILSASICAIAMAAAVPAFAADKPVHHHAHHGKAAGKMGPHTKMKPAGAPSTEELNAKSLDAARGGAAPAADATAPAAPAAPAPAAPASGSTGTMTPSNAPGGQ